MATPPRRLSLRKNRVLGNHVAVGSAKNYPTPIVAMATLQKTSLEMPHWVCYALITRTVHSRPKNSHN